MSTKDRIDVSVLDARARKLLEQIAEYRGVHIHASTRRKLLELDKTMKECSKEIKKVCKYELLSISSTNSKDKDIDYLNLLNQNSQRRYQFKGGRYVYVEPSTVNSDSNLTLQHADVDSNYSPRRIVQQYSLGFRAVKAEVPECGIAEIGRFGYLLSEWYNRRFTPMYGNDKFFYKAANIKDHINLLILFCSHTLNESHFAFNEFMKTTQEWVNTLNTNKDENYPLPRFMFQFRGLGPDMYTEEAVLLERIIKPCIYNNTFYPEELNSIESYIVNNDIIDRKRISIESIVAHSKNLTISPTFDLNKYVE